MYFTWCIWLRVVLLKERWQILLSPVSLFFMSIFFVEKTNDWSLHSARITISCRMNFDDYPLDAHTCQFQVGSCKYYTHYTAAFYPNQWTETTIDILCKNNIKEEKLLFVEKTFVSTNFASSRKILHLKVYIVFRNNLSSFLQCRIDKSSFQDWIQYLYLFSTLRQILLLFLACVLLIHNSSNIMKNWVNKIN